MSSTNSGPEGAEELLVDCLPAQIKKSGRSGGASMSSASSSLEGVKWLLVDLAPFRPAVGVEGSHLCLPLIQA